MNYFKYIFLALFCLNLIACGSSTEEKNTADYSNIENNKHVDDARIFGKFLAEPNLEEILKTTPETQHESLKKNAANSKIMLEFNPSGQIHTSAKVQDQTIEQKGVYTLKNNELTITYENTKPQVTTLQRTPNGFLMKNGNAHYILIRQ